METTIKTTRKQWFLLGVQGVGVFAAGDLQLSVQTGELLWRSLEEVFPLEDVRF